MKKKLAKQDVRGEQKLLSVRKRFIWNVSFDGGLTVVVVVVETVAAGLAVMIVMAEFDRVS